MVSADSYSADMQKANEHLKKLRANVFESEKAIAKGESIAKVSWARATCESHAEADDAFLVRVLDEERHKLVEAGDAEF